MDLVFRISNKDTLHPWRYFVLDWKSDSLARYDAAALQACVVDRHYDLQATIYCHALDRYLKGVLGDAYDPLLNLGGALYVFLRSFEENNAGPQQHTWTRSADPVSDARYTDTLLDSFRRPGPAPASHGNGSLQ
jgi:hypothetical protein